MSDKENGFLTERDKEFLQADGDYYTGENAKNQRYETREVIAERARQAFHDFALLYDVLDQRERNRIFDIDADSPFETDFDPDSPSANDLETGLIKTVAFLYHSLEGDAGEEPYRTGRRVFAPSFEQILRSGVRRGESRRRGEGLRGVVGVDLDVTVTSITGRSPKWEHIVDALARGRVNELDDPNLRAALALATNPTDRLRELADMIEEARGGRYRTTIETDRSLEDLADAAESLSELMSDDSNSEGTSEGEK